MKSIHHVKELPFTDNPRRYLSNKITSNSTVYFEYLLGDGNLLIGHNDGARGEMPTGTPHKHFEFLKFIERIDDLPKSLNNNEALFKWENYKRIRCTIEEAKEYLK